MALQKKNVSLNFLKGLELKTDSLQIPLGKFTALNNMVFSVVGRLTKRNGFGNFASPAAGSFLTTLNKNLLANSQSSLYAYSSGLNSWPVTSPMPVVSLSTQPLIRNNQNQSGSDTAFSSNNMICTVYPQLESELSSNFGVIPTFQFYFAVADSVTGQNYIAPTQLANCQFPPRVFSLGNYFIVSFVALISATYHFQYIAINSTNLSIGSATDIATASSAFKFDGTVVGSELYFAYCPAGVNLVKVRTLSSSLVLGTATTLDSSHEGDIFSVCADTTSTPVIWISYWASGTQNGYVTAISTTLTSILSPTQFLTSVDISNLTSTAASAVCNLLYEIPSSYTYDNTIANDFVGYSTCTQSGTVAGKSPIAFGIGLGSKAFIYNGTTYFVAAYQSEFQSTNFLLNLSGQVISKFAWENGGGYPTQETLGITLNVLPSVTVSGQTASVSYLFKDFVTADGLTAAGATVSYFQTGVNSITFSFSTTSLQSLEVAGNLHYNGGFLWAYDGGGNGPVEHNFFLFPDYVEATTTSGTKTPTGTIVMGSNVVVTLSSTVGLAIGQIVTGTNIPANTYVTGVDYVNQIVVMSAAATANATETLTFTGSLIEQTYQYIATYESSDNQGNLYRSAPSLAFSIQCNANGCTNTVFVPTYRLTYKTGNVKIVLYRWSTAQQNFFQVSSIQSPIQNSTTSNFITFYDSTPDTNTQVTHVPLGINGNNLLYTTGGVVEDVGAPAFSAMALFNGRLCGIPAEDPSGFWYSKTVVPATPVEMSDQLTYTVPPTIGAQSNTGNLSCLYPMDDKLILFHPFALNYINGDGPDSTGNNTDFPLSPIFIPSTVGFSNKATIVEIPSGLLFQSTDKGIYRIQRNLSVDYLGISVEALVLGNTITSAVLIPGTTQVRFSISTGTVLMYDYEYDQWGTFENLPSVSSTIYQGLHTLITSGSQVMQETPNVYYDGTTPVLWNFTTSWVELAGLQGYQRAYWLFLLGLFESPHTLTVGVAEDYDDTIIQSTTFDPDTLSPALTSGKPEQWQFNFQKQQCQAFQLSVQENYDSSIGPPNGAGFSLSALDLVVGIKKGYPRNMSASQKLG